MLIAEKHKANQETIKELETDLVKSENNINAYEAEAKPLRDALNKLARSYNYSEHLTKVKNIPSQIKELETEYYLYFTELVLKFMQKIEDREDYLWFDVEDFLDKYDICILGDIDECLRNREVWKWNEDTGIFMDDDEDWEDCDVIEFNKTFTAEELQKIYNEMMLAFNGRRIASVLSSKIVKGMDKDAVEEILNRYDVNVVNKSYPLKIKVFEEDNRIYVIDEENNPLFNYPDFVDVDILVVRLEEELDRVKKVMEEDPDFALYQKLKAKFGT